MEAEIELVSSPIGGGGGGMDVEPLTGPDLDMLSADENNGGLVTTEDIDLLDADHADSYLDDAEMTVDGADEEEVEMREMGEEVGGIDELSYDDEVPEDEFEIKDPPTFKSPPTVQVRDNGHQIQALGHTSEDDGISGEVAAPDDGSGAAPAPDSAATDAVSGDVPNADQPPPENTDDPAAENQAQNREADGNGDFQSYQADGILATQHQGTNSADDNVKEQEQTLEGSNPQVARLTQNQSQGDSSSQGETKQLNEISIQLPSTEANGFEVETSQSNRGPKRNGKSGPIGQINIVNVMSREDDCASNTASGASLVRPRPAKDLIRQVSFGPTVSRYFDHFNTSLSSSPSDTYETGRDHAHKPNLRAPPIQLTFEGVTYDLFCPPQSAPLLPGEGPQERGRHERAGGGVAATEGEAPGEHSGLLLGDPDEHALYFNHLESLAARLHEIFPEFDVNSEEMVFVFAELGITVPEDNVYTREISLYDLDRLHVGAQLSGRLHIHLERQPRLIHRFNVLAQFVHQLEAAEDNGSEEGYSVAIGQDDERSEDPGLQDQEGQPDGGFNAEGHTDDHQEGEGEGDCEGEDEDENEDENENEGKGEREDEGEGEGERDGDGGGDDVGGSDYGDARGDDGNGDAEADADGNGVDHGGSRDGGGDDVEQQVLGVEAQARLPEPDHDDYITSEELASEVIGEDNLDQASTGVSPQDEAEPEDGLSGIGDEGLEADVEAKAEVRADEDKEGIATTRDGAAQDEIKAPESKEGVNALIDIGESSPSALPDIDYDAPITQEEEAAYALSGPPASGDSGPPDVDEPAPQASGTRPLPSGVGRGSRPSTLPTTLVPERVGGRAHLSRKRSKDDELADGPPQEAAGEDDPEGEADQGNTKKARLT